MTEDNPNPGKNVDMLSYFHISVDGMCLVPPVLWEYHPLLSECSSAFFLTIIKTKRNFQNMCIFSFISFCH